MTVIRLRKRLIGAEDISFDSGNRNETFQTDGTSFPMQKLNAAHLPVGADAVAYVGKPNVSEALIDHERRLRQAAEGMSSLSEDTTITFEANSSPDSRQQRIDAIPRNLGGHLLTVVHYPETMAVTGPLRISGFYNGEVRLSGSYATYSSGKSAALSLSDCQCRVLVNGLSFSFAKTAISVTGCTNVQLMDCVFTGNDTGSSKAVFASSSMLTHVLDAMGEDTNTYSSCSRGQGDNDVANWQIDSRLSEFVRLGDDGKLPRDILPKSLASVSLQSGATLTLGPDETWEWTPTATTCTLTLLGWNADGEEFSDFLLSLPADATLTSADCVLADELTPGAVNHCVVRGFRGSRRLFVVDVIEEASAS